MKIKRINPHLYVAIEFEDVDGTQHTAKDWPELADKVEAYRKRRGLPPGSPAKEIVEQVCERHPDRCENVGRRGAQPTRKYRKAIHNRILDWVVKFVDKVKWVTHDEAARRAAICKSCPRQRDWRGNCSSCRGTVDKIVAGLLQRRAKFDLRGCNALGEDCRLSVHLDQPGIADEELPDNCWRRAK